MANAEKATEITNLRQTQNLREAEMHRIEYQEIAQKTDQHIALKK